MTFFLPDRSTGIRDRSPARAMELAKKVKIALDETRMLILGAQILLGFQLRSAFSEGFDRLSAVTRLGDVAGLALMVITVALLIMPDTYHRIAEGGADSGHFHRIVTAAADIALLPFALALGLDVYLATDVVFGPVPAAAAGSAGAAVALGLWYALPHARRRMVEKRPTPGYADEPDEHPATPLHTRIEQMLIEGRVVLPGVQALLAFQLLIVLTHSFAGLPPFLRVLHAISLGLVALAVMLLMAPAAYHRIVFAGEETEEVYRVGSLMVVGATLPLALGLSGDIYVVIARIVGTAAGLAAGLVSLALLLGLWFGLPIAVALAHRRRGGGTA